MATSRSAKTFVSVRGKDRSKSRATWRSLKRILPNPFLEDGLWPRKRRKPRINRANTGGRVNEGAGHQPRVAPGGAGAHQNQGSRISYSALLCIPSAVFLAPFDKPDGEHRHPKNNAVEATPHTRRAGGINNTRADGIGGNFFRHRYKAPHKGLHIVQPLY